MKTIKKDELYQGLNDFLRTKGIELKEGAYSQRIGKACGLLTDAINETQKTVKRAKVKVDEKLEQLRQSIHEATAPKPPPPSNAKPSGSAPGPKKTAASRKPSAAKRVTRRKK